MSKWDYCTLGYAGIAILIDTVDEYSISYTNNTNCLLQQSFRNYFNLSTMEVADIEMFNNDGLAAARLITSPSSKLQ